MLKTRVQGFERARVQEKNENKNYHRHSIRLPEYDYTSNGAYFVTLCVQDRKYLFGDIINGKIKLNEYGKIVYNEWIKTAKIRNEITLDQFVIMPNHFHAIIWITNNVRAHGRLRKIIPGVRSSSE